jgi:5-methylthioadenosine/S-adenosylhomocysteine deaminase
MLVLKTLIKNIAELYTGQQAESQKSQFILIDDNYIEKIAPMAELTLADEYDRVIDAAGKMVLPGLINTHTHSAMTLLRGYADDMPLDSWLQDKIWPFESEVSADDIYWGTALAAIEMIKTGTTTFSDMYFAMPQVAELVADSGMRAVLAEGLIEANDGQAGLEKALEFACEYNNTAEGRITTMLAPHAPYTCSEEYLAQITDLAAANDLAVHIHISESKKELANFQKDQQRSPIKFLADINFFKNHVVAAHCVHLAPGDLEIFRKNKVNVSHNPMSNAKLANGIAPVVDYLKNEINVGLGTDGVSSNNSLDLIKEARMAAYLQKIKYSDPTVLPTDQLLAMLTQHGARALNLNNVGELAAGKLADLIIINIDQTSFSIPRHNNLSNLFYAADSQVIESVMINGRLVLDSGELKTLDQEKIFYEVEKRAFKIADKLKGVSNE